MAKTPEERNNPMNEGQGGAKCGAKTSSGGRCKRSPAPGRKKCNLHGGKSPGAPKGNQNARKHGAYSSRGGLIEALPDVERDALDAIVITEAHSEAIKIEIWLLRRLLAELAEAEVELLDMRENGMEPEVIATQARRVGVLRKGASIHTDKISKMALRLAQAQGSLFKAGLDDDKKRTDAEADQATVYILEQIYEARRGVG